MTLAPIALFVYKRPDHAKYALQSLMKCPEYNDSPLYIFSDGFKSSKDEANVNQTRRLVRSLAENKAIIYESQGNLGLAKSIIHGVTSLIDEFGKVIVLEDDLVVDPYFLTFMNHALRKYEHENNVMQISGYMFPVPEFREMTEAMFFPFINSWGWATWKNAWFHFEADINGIEILERDIKLRSKFNLDNSYDYYEMLKYQYLKLIDSWAIRWYWSFFTEGGLTLFPPQSLVENIGFDGSGSHGWRSNQSAFNSRLEESIYPKDIKFPEEIVVNPKLFNQLKRTIARSSNPFKKIYKKLKFKIKSKFFIK